MNDREKFVNFKSKNIHFYFIDVRFIIYLFFCRSRLALRVGKGQLLV